MTDHIDTDRLDELLEAIISGYQERLERELIGAWMAGYDYLDVAQDHHHASTQAGGTVMQPMRYAFIPRTDPAPDAPVITENYRVERYDLRVLDRETADHYRPFWGDDGGR